MPASGSSIFTDAVGYQASLQDLLDLVVPEPRAFHARLTWLDLPMLHVLRAQESATRVGILRPPVDRVLIGFPTRPESTIVVDGAELRFGDAIVHALNEMSHHRTTKACEWGSLSLPAASLRTYGRIIAGREFAPPPTGQILHLATKPRQRLLHVHRQAARLAETHLTRVIHPEVARALEHDLIAALIGAIGGKPSANPSPNRRAAAPVQRYEMMIAEHQGRPLRIKDVCAELDVSQHMFRASCAEIFAGPLSAVAAPQVYACRAAACRRISRHRESGACTLRIWQHSSICHGILGRLRRNATTPGTSTEIRRRPFSEFLPILP
jgi:hypothetical protein